MRDELIGRAARMGVAISPESARRFEEFHAMLMEANARMNLTRVPDDLSGGQSTGIIWTRSRRSRSI